VRPELAVSFLALALAALGGGVWVVVRQPRQARRLVAPTLLVVGCAVLLLRGMGTPLGGTRSFIAFHQHYAMNQFLADRIPLGASLHSEHIVARDFGNASTV